jgi:putative flippase GtrA
MPNDSHKPALVLFVRWLKFNAVGGLGIFVQLAALALFKSGFGWNYLAATAAAVEAAVLHNFVWHEHWTWRPGDRSFTAVLSRLVSFNLTTGALSIASNLLFMRILVGWLGLPYLPANLAAIAITNIGNFALSEFLVFRPKAAKP